MMRTYSRKRLDYKELENVADLCRLCLEKTEEGKPIFKEVSCYYSSLALRIMVCVGLEITKEDCLPNFICLKCYEEVERYYLFRKKCEASYIQLKSHCEAVRTKKIKDEQNNLMFTVNSDGTLNLQDGNTALFDRDDQLAKLTKLFSDEEKQKKEIEIVHTNEPIPTIIDLPSNDVDGESKINKINKLSELPSLTPATILETKQDSEPEARPPDPDISVFLSNMLTELGILSQQEDGTVNLEFDHNRILELETRDGCNITFELEEEMEDVVHNPAVNVKTLGHNKDGEQANVKEKKAGSPASPTRQIYKCEQCGKFLASRGVLTRHVRDVHTRARPHVCNVCARSFAQKDTLARHLLVHADKRPFQCDKCPKNFTQRSSLETHSRVHTKEITLYPCPKCTKLFLYASGLSRHLNQHTKTVYPCGECGRAFSDKSSLRRHERIMKHRPSKSSNDVSSPGKEPASNITPTNDTLSNVTPNNDTTCNITKDKETLNTVESMPLLIVSNETNVSEWDVQEQRQFDERKG